MTLLDADTNEQRSVLGEDTCELLATIEDSFGVEFGEYHTLLGTTIRDLADHICKQADYPIAEKCLSAVTFYRLRCAFRTLFDIPRTAIRPTTPVADLLPWNSRRIRWRILQTHLGLTFPSLNYPGWLVCLSAAGPAAFLIFLKVFLGLRLSALGVVGSSLALWIVTLAAFVPLARAVPLGCQTIGGFTKVILARNYAAFASRYGGSSEGDVLMALRQLIATETGRDMEEIVPETRIPDGLNIE